MKIIPNELIGMQPLSQPKGYTFALHYDYIGKVELDSPMYDRYKHALKKQYEKMKKETLKHIEEL